MSSNKDRLYVVLLRHQSYGTRDIPTNMDRNEDRYSWGFMVASKDDKDPFDFYRIKISGLLDAGLPQRRVEAMVKKTKAHLQTIVPLVRILVAKVEDQEKLAGIIQGATVEQSDDRISQIPAVQWAEHVIIDLLHDQRQSGRQGRAIGTCRAGLDWLTVRDAAMFYVDMKFREGRFDSWSSSPAIPTFDLIEMRETVK